MYTPQDMFLINNPWTEVQLASKIMQISLYRAR